jgi:UDP-3-O-[3-hydroxymyristoyl] glucosamine N-acyltransferase
MNVTLQELAEALGADVDGDAQARAQGVCPPHAPMAGHVVFLDKPGQAEMLKGAGVAAVLCSRTADITGFNLLRAEYPKLAFARALAFFNPTPKPAPGAHARACVHPEAVVHAQASIGACAVVEQGAHVGPGTVMHAGVYVGPNAHIGENCTLHPNSTVLQNCVLGDRVTLHSGAVIGADGFGYVLHQGEHVKVPQVGRVVIGSDVEIGAGTTVDRATLGDTVIGDGAKIDNQVQIGHNCRIGRGVIICGSVGISGSCTIGDYAVLAGQAGVSDHITIGARAIIGGKAGVTRDVPEGKFYSGMPAGPHRDAMRQAGALQKLPDLLKDLDALRKQVELLNKDEA